MGGWTPTYEGDPCQGGHPGFHTMGQEDGQTVPRCNRCGRVVVLRPCGCTEHQGSALGRSYCPVRMRMDHQDVEQMARAGILLPVE